MSKGLRFAFDETKVDAIFSRVDQSRLPGGAVGIAVRGRPVYRRGFGLANMELPVVVSPATKIRIASVSKHFTCLCYLLLCERGRARLDDPIGKYLPELAPINKEPTIRHIMGHLSGLRDAHDLSWQLCGTAAEVSSQELLRYYVSVNDRNSAPGVEWRYNNGAFLLLGCAIERIADSALEEFMKENVFGPLGMYDTQLRRSDNDFVYNSAALHTISAEGAFRKASFGTALSGEGGIVSTVDDLLRWLSHMDDPVVGNRDTWKIIRTPQVLINGHQTGYGCGLVISNYRGVETLSHIGGVIGANSYILKIPALDLDIVVLINRHDIFGLEFALKIVDSCLIGLEAVPDWFSRHVAGNFRSKLSGRVVQLYSQGGQQLAAIDGLEMPLAADRSGALCPAGVWSYVRQVITTAGNPERPEKIIFSDFGNVDELDRLDDRPVEECNVLIGQYESRSTGALLTVDASRTNISMKSTGRHGSATFKLEALEKNVWRAHAENPWLGGIVTFNTNSGQLSVSTARNRAVIFDRRRPSEVPR